MKMKKNRAVLLAVCLFAVLLAGCGEKGNTSADGDISGSGDMISGSSKNENPPVEVSDPHAPIVNGAFELNGIRFWYRDEVEMECLVLEDLQLAEITLDGTMLHVSVYDKEDQSEWYDNTVSRGTKEMSTSGDVCYRSITDLMWEIATESGKLIVLYGEPDSGDGWKDIGQMIEWTAIDGDHVDIKYPNTGFTIKDGMFEPTNGVVLTSAGQPLTLGNITISEVLLSDTYDYRVESEHPDLEEKAYYDFNMIEFQVSEDEWGLAPFLSYLVPSDATITLYPSEENVSFYFVGHNVFAEEGSDTWKRTDINGIVITSEDMEPIVFTLDDFKQYFPGLVCLSCSMDQQRWYDMMFVD